jgi:SOS-response transcriptional repressor LexA
MQKLTPKLQNMLIQIHKFQSEHGYMPSYAEMAVLISGNPRSFGTAQCRIDRLVKLGYLNSHCSSEARSLKFAKHIEFQGQKIPVLGICN